MNAGGPQLDQLLGRLLDDCRQAAQRRGLADGDGWQTIESTLRRRLAVPADWAGAPAPNGDADTDAVSRLVDMFALEPDEGRLLLVAAAADIEPAFAHAFGALLGVAEPRVPTVALLLELAGFPLRSARGRALLGSAAPLRTWGLIRVSDGGPGMLNLARTCTVGEDVVAALLGAPIPDTATSAMEVPPVRAGRNAAAGPEGAAELVAAGLAAGRPLIWVQEDAGGAGLWTARAAFGRAGLRCRVFDLHRRPTNGSLVDLVATLVRRAALASCSLVATGAELLADDGDAAAAVQLLWYAPVPVVLVGQGPWHAHWHEELPVVVLAATPTAEQRLAMWRDRLPAAMYPDESLLSYRLRPEQIAEAARHSSVMSELQGRPFPVAESVRLLDGPLGTAGRVGAFQPTFDDLQLPPVTMAELRRLAAWIKRRDAVTGRRAYALGGKGTGVSALFAGNPGTGKTLAAHVLAADAGLRLLQVELSGVIDKYIGETEKNLERIFAAAERLNVLLFFDEADAIFGSRSEVRDARDRYANQEVSYLLQRMEQFDGASILATNLRGNLDAAFVRRLQFVVHFPEPDAPTRARLLATLLNQAAPLDDQDPIDIPALAADLDLAGGDLRNIVLAASYDALIEGGRLGRRHVDVATRREYAKLGRRPPTLSNG